jgi:hypothetical protein
MRQAVILNYLARRKIRLIESNAKCPYLKKLTCKGILRQVFICLRPTPPSYDPMLPPLTHCIRVYSKLIHTGKGGRGGGKPVFEAISGHIR